MVDTLSTCVLMMFLLHVLLTPPPRTLHIYTTPTLPHPHQHQHPTTAIFTLASGGNVDLTQSTENIIYAVGLLNGNTLREHNAYGDAGIALVQGVGGGCTWCGMYM